MNAVPNVALDGGNALPQLGFGAFQISRVRLLPHRHA